MIGFSTHSDFIHHLTGPHHPERPDRIRAIARAVRAAGLIASPDPFPDFLIDLGAMHGPAKGPEKLLELTPAPADESMLQLIHHKAYIDRVRHTCSLGGVLDSADTPVCAASFQVALLALGSGLTAADAVMNGQVRRAFSAARPPGHHAEPQRPMGFCLFSNVAIVARHIQRTYNIQRVAIVDFDVHHGNGTQACFENDPSVLFISLHQNPRTCYPGSGYPWETGEGAGRGFTINIPFDPGTDDADYLQAMNARVLPALDDFHHEVLLLSAGFDGHRDDPLAQINLSEMGFFEITRLLCESADRNCGGRVVSLLEGGYNLRALARCVVRHLQAMQ